MPNVRTIDVKDASKCCGCGACAFVCPRGAIEFYDDAEGFARPKIDEKRCSSCGRCLRVCATQSNGATLPTTEPVAIYGVKHKDRETRRRSRSGGAFTAISDVVLERGGVVYGARAVAVDEVKHVRAENKTERDALRGSKYVQSDATNVYASVERDLRSGRETLFTGTPCQCAAIAATFDRRKFPNLILCDLICRGVPSRLILRDYIRWIERKRRSRVLEFTFRDKENHSWASHVEKIVLADETYYSKRYRNLFHSGESLRVACFSCPFATTKRASDFTIGDYWEIDKIRPEFNDGGGVSIALLRSDGAAEIFKRAQSALDWFDASDLTPPHYNLRRPTKKPEKRDKFWNDYRKFGFEYVSKKYGGCGFWRRMKRKLIDRVDYE